ncbi:MAG TPA: undecaprenyldiphospho-muramoylpentapeptide beta-N-acetylglucosaminyltransferase [Candidatus Saccharicenans sp.]|jgi:UDP-N-acetylglucosamine--N-acetylmuramyl-(pentapeptide) pyrophosphoryl-undecaprenol N-acetylglucosamine transferase|nr:undecaprenyldiphospho-muramoylpentapeptide beta-N-acetylglucosaminyltransferase [Candidatus Saccharicenans sp.]HRD01671.1 undecaprenyldiphospho-muramoylpentapeptide beta-N-acetylglucosaminyltransferase [Candidatus Saccharicenans sp.]
MRKTTVLISGGGTGGHLYPAVVLGQKLKEFKPEVELIYIGSQRAVEKKIMAEQSLTYLTLPVEGLKGRGWKKLRGFVLLPLAMVKSLAIILKYKPALVIGVGGFSSGPVVLLASCLKKPTLILEQNALPGFTNRLLSRFADQAVVSFPSSLQYFKGKGVLLGNPVRPEFYKIPRKQAEEALTLLIFGGSQGSKFLNDRIIDSLPYLIDLKNSLIIYHQTGERDFDRVKEAYEQAGFERVTVSPYFSPMPEYLAAADLVLCRAGATTCAELIAAARPAILVPFAAAADNHQEWNARELEQAGGAEVVLEKDFSPKFLSDRLKFYMNNYDVLIQMGDNLQKLRQEDSAARLASLALDMIKVAERRR